MGDGLGAKVKRDPRLDPKPGDVLVRDGHRRTVASAPGLVVQCDFKIPLPDLPDKVVISIADWRVWAAGATVVKRGK